MVVDRSPVLSLWVPHLSLGECRSVLFRSPMLLFRHFIGSLVLVALVPVSFVGVILLVAPFLL
jgi:hypothetical protein